jgi:hypothetical protein
MTIQDAIKAEMTRYVKACAAGRTGDAHRHLATYRRLLRRPGAPLTVHEQLRMLAGV